MQGANVTVRTVVGGLLGINATANANAGLNIHVCVRRSRRASSVAGLLRSPWGQGSGGPGAMTQIQGDGRARFAGRM